MKFVDFIKKHTVAFFAICVGVVSILVGGIYFIKFSSDYNKYETEYNRMQEEINSKFAKAPEDAYIDANFVTYSGDTVSSTKSNYKNSVVFGASSAVINPLSTEKAGRLVNLDSDNNKLSQCISGLDEMGGAINFYFMTDHYGYADIEISMRTSLLDSDNNLKGLENITDYIKVQMNKMDIKTVDAELGATSEFTSLILRKCFLLEGENVVTFTTSAYNPINTESKGSDDQGKTNSSILYVMPDIRNLTVFSNVNVTAKDV
ncbi:MAG: hypothetical protein J6T15_04400 [Bacilli bacterium]|nr:hypothetical protein [Bacilli bacterium]